MEWRLYGGVGVLVELENPEAVLSWCAAIDSSPLDLNARPGWQSVLVTSKLSTPKLVDALHSLELASSPVIPAVARREVAVPVVYNGEDLHVVAASTGLSVEAVVKRHIDALYTVVFLGFSRAFPYLSGLDPALWIPRRAIPRARVPAGAVAIAAGQTGIYPQSTPGGWHLLGHCALSFFDERDDPPSSLQPGDHVRFVAP